MSEKSLPDSWKSTDAGQPERTLGQLVADASHDISGLIRSEVALAKAEVTTGAKTMGKGAGMFGAAGFVALLGVIFLFHFLAQVIAIWLPVWASYGIVTLLLFLVAGILALLGKSAVSKAKPKPELAITEAQQTIATIKGATR